MLVLLATAALAAHPPAADVPKPPPLEAKGTFDAAPVPMWDVRLPGGYLNSATHTERTRPLVVGDDVLVGSAAGKGLYMLSRRDGGLVRTFPATGSVESAAVVVGNDVFFADTGGVVWCYDLDGTELWRHPTGAPILVEPMVDDGQVFATNVDDLAVALDAKTGELDWQYHRKPDPTREAELTLYAAPPAVALGTDVLLGFSDGSIAALDRKRGDVSWEKRGKGWGS